MTTTPHRADRLFVHDTIPAKKRRLQGACDTCRRKKIKCDSAKMPGQVCSNCVAFDSICTHVLASKGKNKTAAMYQNSPLDTSSHKLFAEYAATRSKVIAILSPVDPYAVPEDKVAVRQLVVEMSHYIHALETELMTSRTPHDSYCAPALSEPAVPEDHISFADTDDNVLNDDVVLSDYMKQLSISQSYCRFYGQSSNALLVRAVVDLCKQNCGSEVSLVPQNRSIAKRPEYWTVYPWQWIPEEESPPFVFPDPDLLEELIELYFTNCNLYFPIFHKPSFIKLVLNGVHLRDKQFGAIVLVVCAIGSRYSHDPRVFSENAGTEQSSGWKWFSQVRPQRISFVAPPSLYLVQLFCTYIWYLHGTSTPESCWIFIGIAVKMIQDVGAHRKVQGEKRTVENELWRRVFWAVIMVDISISALLGRPRATHPEDYDQDLPADCDDEYWETEDPADAFKQPPGKPSTISYFLSSIRLINILGLAMRTIYAVNPSDLTENQSKHQLDEQIILRIDSELNEWVDSVPHFLRWDPRKKDQIFFDQSAALYATYYYVQIIVHKPFIRDHPGHCRDHRADRSSLSVAICANAARSCVHLMDVQSRRGFVPVPHVQFALFNSGVVLILNHLANHQLGFSSNSGKEYIDVQKCIQILHFYEARWHVAGRMCDLLNYLLTIGESWSKASTPHQNSLDHQFEDNVETTRQPELATRPALVEDGQPWSVPDIDQLFTLPFYTDELSRSPLHALLDSSQEVWKERASQYTLSQDFPAGHTSSSALYNGQEFAMLESTDPAQLYPSATDTGANAMDTWFKTPSGYDWDDWATYHSSVEGLMHNARHP